MSEWHWCRYLHEAVRAAEHRDTYREKTWLWKFWNTVSDDLLNDARKARQRQEGLNKPVRLP